MPPPECPAPVPAEPADPSVDHGGGPTAGVHSGSSGGHPADTLAFVTIRAGLTALCVVAALAGCTEAAAPAPLPSVPTASPTAAALPIPPEATPETPQGAAAFTRYYFDVVNRAFVAGDASDVRRLSDPECEGCNNLVRAIEEEPDPGERIEGGEFEVIFAESPPVEGGDVIVDLRYAVTELRVVGQDGRVIRTTPAEPGIDAQLRLIREGQAWVVRGFRNVQS